MFLDTKLYLQLLEFFSDKNMSFKQDRRDPPNISVFISLQLVDVMEEHLLDNCDLMFTTLPITHSLKHFNQMISRTYVNPSQYLQMVLYQMVWLIPSGCLVLKKMS